VDDTPPISTPLSALLDLSGKTAVVTGAARGMGKSIALRLHEAGAAVTVADLDEAAAQETADQLNLARQGSALATGTDVGDAGSVAGMVGATVNRFGGIDILVNNAGIYPMVPLAAMSEADFMKVVGVNLLGVFLCTKAVSDRMVEQGRGGRIITITSIDAIHPSRVGLAHYDASKHGAWGFVKNVALELAEHRIWVNAIAPGPVATPGAAAAEDVEVDPAALEAMTQRIPMKRFGDPDEIARVALFLASDLAGFMTGAQVVVDGGLLLG
jgi:2-dehydro-3-deoxy-D-gluconate 5-dehydrogenase